MEKVRYAFCAWLILMAIGGTGCDTESEKQKVGPEIQKSGSEKPKYDWTEFFSITPDESYDDTDDKAEWWADLSTKLHGEFWRNCSEPDYKDRLKSLVRQFGTRGADADMKLCLMDPGTFLPRDYMEPAADMSKNVSGQSEEIHQARKNRYREIQLLLSRFQAEIFLEDREILDRYYNMLIWSRMFLGSPEYHCPQLFGKTSALRKGFHEESEDYWWYARDFILLAHATGRDDLLEGATTENLVERFEKWYTWVIDRMENRLKAHPKKPIWIVVPHVFREDSKKLREPKLPFDDWDSKRSPPSPLLIIHMADFLYVPLKGEDAFVPVPPENLIRESKQEN